MADQPDRAQAGDELARQAGVVDAGLSFAEGLAERRATISGPITASAATEAGKEVGQVEADLRDFSTVAPGRNPLNRLRALRDVSSQSAGFLQNLADLLVQRENSELSLREQKLKEREAGLKYNPETGDFEPLSPEDTLLTPDGEELTDEQKEKAILSGSAAILEVKRQGGDFLFKGVSVKDKAAIAEQILQQGGVDAVRKSMPLDSLLNDKERAEIADQTELEGLLDQAIEVFQATEGPGGTGPLAFLIPGFAAGEMTRQMRRLAENITAQYAKSISGATISDREIERLRAFLPTSKKTETENFEDLIQLAKDLKANQEIFARAKQEGLTVNEAYDKYSSEVLGLEGGDSSKSASDYADEIFGEE